MMVSFLLYFLIGDNDSVDNTFMSTRLFNTTDNNLDETINSIKIKENNIRYDNKSLKTIIENKSGLEEIMLKTNTKINFVFFNKITECAFENKILRIVNCNVKEIDSMACIFYSKSYENSIKIIKDFDVSFDIYINYIIETDIIDLFKNKLIDLCNENRIESLSLEIFNIDNLEKYLYCFFDEFLRNSKNKFVKKVYLCEKKEENYLKILDFLEKYKDKNECFYQFQWKNDKDIFEDFDKRTNEIIMKNYIQNPNKTVKISYDSLKVPGTHEVDLNKMEIKHKNYNSIEKLVRKYGIWSKSNEEFDLEANRIIDENYIKNQMKFDLFLCRYYIDFNKMLQININSGFSRDINIITNKKEKVKIYEKKKDIIKEINVNYYDYIDFDKCKDLLDCLIKNDKIKETFKIPDYFGKKVLELIEAQIKKYRLTIIYGNIDSNQEIKIKGLSRYIDKFKIFFKILKKSNMNKNISVVNEIIEYPKEWNKNDKAWSLIELSKNSNEYLDVATRFSLYGSNKILKISRIQNKKLYEDYLKEKSTLYNLKKAHGINLEKDCNEKLVWYGSKIYKPEDIFESQLDGFDLNFAEDGLWGRGLYFAERSDYSKVNFNEKKEIVKGFFWDSEKIMLVKIFIGETIEKMPDSSLRKPPFLPNKKDLRYDSVKGMTNKGPIYILYEMRRAYPCYLVEFE